ncbi:hypothetical protein GCM10010371_66020 [Streptomyces subrutilus]|uniref:Uncharacterized protein n=1 Tax=Streptomyces subrutilus TaxID=36818 RepID=A0A918RHA9_9ACTN|nr:hypothetical protein [Streptomyces subrutilus]GGZ96891.1 hypothetical protein GCM10010371_66020 [Streptomyces subrutilus]
MVPDQQPTPATDTLTDAEARRLIDAAYRPTHPTSYRDDTPNPAYGTTPPVAQPGRPPMSQHSADTSGLLLSGSVAALSVGGATSLVLWSLDQVDPLTLAVGAAGPVALVLAAGSLLRSAARAKTATTPSEHHHHYNGPVRQQNTTLSSTTKGLVAKTGNTTG